MSENTNDKNMAETLAQAGKLAEEQKTQRRERTVKGSHLLAQMTEAVAAAGLKAEDKSGFTKVTGKAKGLAVYVAKKGGRVDLSGFTVQSAAIKQITEQEARDKHLGKVRGQVDFDQTDALIMEAFGQALGQLDVETTAEPTKAKPAKEPKPAKEKKEKPAKAAKAPEAPTPEAAVN
ncbi:MAG TPA: hypothetical protein VFT74_19150 [Isosphaeraceae bacterium]|nr:hypothetical protein [Isosphaeraceae bacterium]